MIKGRKSLNLMNHLLINSWFAKIAKIKIKWEYKENIYSTTMYLHMLYPMYLINDLTIKYLVHLKEIV